MVTTCYQYFWANNTIDDNSLVYYYKSLIHNENYICLFQPQVRSISDHRWYWCPKSSIVKNKNLLLHLFLQFVTVQYLVKWKCFYSFLFPWIHFSEAVQKPSSMAHWVRWTNLCAGSVTSQIGFLSKNNVLWPTTHPTTTNDFRICSSYRQAQQ